jgi:glycosyltransferase involved in cell wall biosynthesis
MTDVRSCPSADVVVFQKKYSSEELKLAESLRDRGTVTVFDLCDDHFYNPDNLPKLAARADRLHAMIDLVDAVSVSTEPLRQLVTGKETAVIDDAFDEVAAHRAAVWRRRLTRGMARGDELRLVWYGNAGLESPSSGLRHVRKVVPVLNDLGRHRRLRLTIISNSRETYEQVLGDARFPTEYHEWEKATFPALFTKQDVCIIPIEENPFTIAKTANRVALALRLGVPVVADSIPSYEDFAPFVLFGNWTENIERYAADPALRRRHVRAGRAYVDAKYTKERVVDQWSSLFERLLARPHRASELS